MRLGLELSTRQVIVQRFELRLAGKDSWLGSTCLLRSAQVLRSERGRRLRSAIEGFLRSQSQDRAILDYLLGLVTPRMRGPIWAFYELHGPALTDAWTKQEIRGLDRALAGSLIALAEALAEVERQAETAELNVLWEATCSAMSIEAHWFSRPGDSNEDRHHGGHDIDSDANLSDPAPARVSTQHPLQGHDQ